MCTCVCKGGIDADHSLSLSRPLSFGAESLSFLPFYICFYLLTDCPAGRLNAFMVLSVISWGLARYELIPTLR